MVGLIAFISYPNFDPVLLRLGPVSLRWYGLAYLFGFLFGYGLLRKLARGGALRVPLDALGELVSWLALSVIVGGRAGWWRFYHRSEGAAEAWYEPLAIWHGGMSFHGGLIGVVATLVLWSWTNKTSLWNLADSLALVAPIGLFFGRVANFVNAELVGRVTSVPWAVVFPGESFARHPSQLYEAMLEGPLLLAILWTARRSLRMHDGQIAALFLILYGILRFAVEFTREPDEQLGFIAFGWLTMGQLLSVIPTLVGVVFWFILGRSGPNLVIQPASGRH